MSKKSLIIATRESPLALWQANWVKKCLEKDNPQLSVQLLGITTQADRLPYVSLAEIGGKGLFVKELEEALLDRRADIAVHSVKDMPVDLPSGLILPVVLTRESPWDVLVSNDYLSLESLPAGAIVGTASLRRQSQLLHLRPDLITRGIRGNVNTRLAKLDKKEFAAIILAQAGLNRLGLQSRITQVLDKNQFLPAVGQGVLGIECRVDDSATQALIAPLKDDSTYLCITAERAMCRRLGGGCHVPVASFAEISAGKITLRGLVASLDGKKILQAQAEKSLSETESLGISVAEDLLNQGAGTILAAINKEIK
jgi:hydroxymethylbilane synthase